MPTAMIAPGTTENDPVISATMIITASGAWATLPKHAIMPTTTKMPGCRAPRAASTSSPSRQIAAPTNPPMTMPGPKMPPEPPVPIDKRRGDDLGERQHQDDPQRNRHQRVLRRRPAAPSRSRCTGSAESPVPAGRPAARPAAGLSTVPPGSRAVSATVRVEDPGVQIADGGRDDADHDEPQQRQAAARSGSRHRRSRTAGRSPGTSRTRRKRSPEVMKPGIRQR